MSEKICYCFGAGEFYGLDEQPPENALIIAADAGINAVKACGLSADYIIGDFDSLGVRPEGENVIALPVEKDTTDLYEAVKLGKKYGCTVFHLYGGTGGRIDHTAANLQMLGAIAQDGLSGFLHGNGYAFTAISSGKSFSIYCEKGRVSVFSLTDISEGVTLKGLKYPLTDHTLTNTFPLGVSNEFTEQTAEISVKNGTLLIYYERNDTA